MDNPEGQVTYPIYIGRPGYLPALVHLVGVRCVFIFVSNMIKFCGRIHRLIDPNPCLASIEFNFS